jgi:hypothetical protein
VGVTDVSAAAAAEPPDHPGRDARPPGAHRAPVPGPRSPWHRPWVVQAAVLAGFVAAGVVLTWPRARYLAGTLPADNDQGQYVWNMWWIAHQLVHLGNPWFTSYLAAPVGIPLGLDTLTPLPGVLMAPVTLLFGPSASYNLLAIVLPGLAAYAMYRLARLWLPARPGPLAQAGALAAGAFYGLSGMVTFQAWVHEHTAAGCVFLPLAVEAAVRLRRGATVRRGVILGVVVGAAMLTDQQFAVLTVILAALVLLPWLVRQHGTAQLRAVAASAVTAAVISAPQVIAIVQETGDGSTTPKSDDYSLFAAQFPSLFAPSPRLARYGLGGLAHVYRTHTASEGLATFGVVLTVLAVFGLVVCWRRRGTRLLGVLWLGCALLALGPTLDFAGHPFVPLATTWQGRPMSLLMPYTWLIHVPGMTLFREAERLALVGLVGAALLAGAAVDWLGRHARPALIAVAVLGLLEAGWPGVPHQQTMPTALPRVDRPIAADHSGSIVVDVPFGILGTPKSYGVRSSPLALVLATADGHPRAMSYGPLAVPTTVAAMQRHAFYAGLVTAREGVRIAPAQIAAARADLRTLHVGWVLVWGHRWERLTHYPVAGGYHYGTIFRYLAETGFHFDYTADNVVVYRP